MRAWRSDWTFRLAALVCSTLAIAACARSSPDGVRRLDEPDRRPRDAEAPAPSHDARSRVVDRDVVVDTTFSRGEWRVDRTLVVTMGATLTLAPGARLSFGEGTQLRVERGTLLARGTETEPITLTSSASVPGSGHWGGVVLADPKGKASALDHVHLAYVDGKAALLVRGAAKVELGNVEITDCGGAGIVLESAPGGGGSITF